MRVQGSTSIFSPKLAPLFGRRLAIAWLLVMLACAGWTSSALLRGYQFDTSILALLPETQDRDLDPSLAGFVDQQLAALASQRLVFLLSHPNPQLSAQAAQSFADSLAASGEFAALQTQVSAAAADDWQQTFFPFRYNLMTAEARASLPQAPLNEQHPLLQQALARLYSPMASSVAGTLLDDPLQLFFSWQLEAMPKTPFQVEGGWLTRRHEGRTYRLLFATLARDPFELSYQQAVSRALVEAEAQLSSGTELLSSGLLIHAAHGADQARREISTIGFGSLLGIALLLLYCFRRPRYLLLAFLPIACGWLFALSISMMLFERLHLITLAFGASLIGVAIDYSLHYLCAEEDDVAAPALQRILPGISLGLVSSLLAYAAQGIAPFPGLRQMALFSVCGLLGAWLTVVLWLPLLSGGVRRSKIPLHGLADFLARCLARWPRIESKPVALAVAACVALGLYQLTQLEFRDDVRSLQTSPAHMLAEDARVQSLTRAVNPSQFFLISAADEQSLLAAEESLQPALRAMVKAGSLYDFQAVSKWLPSAARQREQRQLNADYLYTEQGLAAQLATAIGSPSLATQMREHFEAASLAPLDFSQFADSAVGEQQKFMWLGEHAGKLHSLVLVAGVRDLQSLEQLAQLAAGNPNIQFVDKVADISKVLEQNRHQLQRWIAAAYLGVGLLLAWRYGHRAWRILAAPAIASLACLAILAWTGADLTLFNLLALLLVLGIGLDAGIFLGESDRGRYTWTAVSLAACTTLLAFGLLSLSATPVLQQFGITVLVGIVGVWCLAPCFVAQNLQMDVSRKVDAP